ncbi:MAG: hypothetical protein H7228_04795 [Polaromonas sp.]|nr:hypothetical protein [Polaromonas sp.]
MKTILHKLFGLSDGSPVTKKTQSPSHDSPLTIEDGSENATRRQLVQVLLRDVLRKSGIPPEWIECQMMLVSSRSKGHGMYVRLVIKHWDDRFMNYAFAFQNELMADISQFEPRATDWLHGISWQLDVAASCPYTRLPEKSFWQTPAEKEAITAVPVTVATPAGKLSATLPDFGVTQNEAPEHPPIRFQATQPFKESAADDLEKLFAIRDRELNLKTGEGVMPVGYEKTQPAPL